MQENEELNIVKNCLKGWISQIETRTHEIEASIKVLKNKIETIFDEEGLKQIRYNLHSVCIHEGNATSGHFWTYIWNKQQSKWYKFNDTEVSESNWEDLYANAVGGGFLNTESDTFDNKPKSKSGQPSAYFLVYVKADEESLYQGWYRFLYKLSVLENYNEF